MKSNPLNCINDRVIVDGGSKYKIKAFTCQKVFFMLYSTKLRKIKTFKVDKRN